MDTEEEPSIEGVLLDEGDLRTAQIMEVRQDVEHASRGHGKGLHGR
jgi:hypothetical protein